MNEYLHCAATALVSNTAVASLITFKNKDLYQPCHGKSIGLFGGIFALNTVLNTLPAVVANILDAYVHPSISDNKFFQYGATVVEAGGISALLALLVKAHISSNAISGIIQGVAFKYILDNAKATNESKVADEVLHNNDVIGYDPQNNNNDVIGYDPQNNNNDVIGYDPQNNNDLTGNYYS